MENLVNANGGRDGGSGHSIVPAYLACDEVIFGRLSADGVPDLGNSRVVLRSRHGPTGGGGEALPDADRLALPAAAVANSASAAPHALGAAAAARRIIEARRRSVGSSESLFALGRLRRRSVGGSATEAPLRALVMEETEDDSDTESCDDDQIDGVFEEDDDA
ncbi:hypothetical protein HK405_001454, partial [Cladochytrium tenue]